MRNEEGKFIILDFLNYVFLLALIIFILVYFVVGDRVVIFQKFMKSLMPFSYYGFGLVYFIKKHKNKVRKFKKEGNFEEITTYNSSIDRIRDTVVIIFLAIINIGVSLILNQFNAVDVLQVFVMLAVLFLEQFIIFRKDQYSDSYIITRKKVVNDGMYICFIPAYIYLLVYMVGEIPDYLDIFQSIFPAIVMYFWHMLLFKKTK